MAEVTSEAHGAVRLLTLNRPDKRNAITTAMFHVLTAALDEAADDDGIKAVVLTGAGDNFSAGIDLATLGEPRDAGVPPSNQFLHALADFPKPVIAAVSGHAVGVGFTLTLLCDLVYAASTTRFRVPFLDMGIVPEAGSSALLPSRVGHHRAAEIFLFGEVVSADQALALGLVNEVHPPDDVLARGLARAEQLCRLDPDAVRHTKSLIGTGLAARAQMAEEEPIFEMLLARRRC